MKRLAAALLVCCAAGAGAQPVYRVAERFEVGRDVYVRALAIEPAAKGPGTLWVGTSGGVQQVDLASGRLRGTFTRKDGLASEYVFAIGVDRQGYKWFGTNAGGASRYRAGQWKTYFPMHGLADYWVYAFAQARGGELWIGTWAGASRFDPKTGAFRNYVKELVNEWVYGISIDAQGRVWFGTEGGVSMFDGARWRAWTHADGVGAPNAERLPPSANTGLGTRSRHDLATSAGGSASYNANYVFAVHVDAKGRVWAGTWGGGVARFDGTKWTNLTRADGLAGDIVFSIAEEPSGALWFGTDGGASRYDGARWQTLGKAQGLIEANVYAIAAARGGDVWIGTRGGVVRARATHDGSRK